MDSGATGILVEDATNLSVSSNVINGATVATGIIVDNDDGATASVAVVGNVLGTVDDGIQIIGASSSSITGVSVIGNTVQYAAGAGDYCLFQGVRL